MNIFPKRIRNRLAESAGVRNIAQNVSWLVAGRVYSILVGILVSAAVARYLGPEQLGLMNYAFAFVMLFQTTSKLGILAVLTRELVREPEARNETLGSAFALCLIGTTISITLICTGAYIVRPDEPYVRVLVMLASLMYIGQISAVLSSWNVSKVQAKYNVMAANIALTVVSAMKIIMICYQASLIWFVCANVVSTLVSGSVLCCFYVRQNGALANLKFRAARIRQLFRDAWPRIPGGVSLNIRNQIGALMVADMIGEAELGQYSVGLKVQSVFFFVPLIICQSVGPSLVRAKAADEELYVRRLAQLYRFLFGLWLLSLLPICFMVVWGITGLYGVAYSPACPLLLLMSLPLLFVYLGEARSWFIVTNNLLQYSMLLGLVSLAVCLPLNYVMIKCYGVVGVIIATILTYAFDVFLFDCIFKPARMNARAMMCGLLTPWRMMGKT